MQGCKNWFLGSSEGNSSQRNKFKSLEQMDEHTIPIEELYERLGTNPNSGLSTDQAKKILRRDGRNVLTPYPKPPGKIRLIFNHFFTLFSFLPWAGTILCIVIFFTRSGISAGEYLSIAFMLIAIIFLNGCYPFYEELKRWEFVDHMYSKDKETVSTIRDHKKQTIKVADLVVGDIIYLKSGDRIPADIRIISANGCKVDNSSLTGEAELVPRTPDCTSEIAEITHNLAFYETTVGEGSCSGVVIRTGDHMLIGGIGTTLPPNQVANTTIRNQLLRSIVWLAWVEVLLGVIYCIIAFVVGYIWIDAIVFFIAIYVANVPQGLILAATISMGYTMKQMSNINCVVSMKTMETLASLTTICSDMSVTLTQNRKTVSNLWFDGTLFKADIMNDQLYTTYRSCESWKALSRIAVFCNDAEFSEDQDAEFSEDQDNAKQTDYMRQYSGNATDIALLQYMESFGDVSEVRTKHRKLCDIPFGSFDKYKIHVAICTMNTPSGSRNILLMKGAPETILERCNTVLFQNEEILLNDDFKKSFNDAVIELGCNGDHVLGLCDQVLPTDQYPLGYAFDTKENNFPLSGFRFVGLASLAHPYRSSVAEAVRKCRSAGIKVVMVTEEQPITAKAIAKRVGIISKDSKTVEDIASERGCPLEEVESGEANVVIVNGSDLEGSTISTQLDDILLNHSEVVFAGINTPYQKMDIVKGYQRHGKIVAITGRSTRDVYALNRADVGVVLGSSKGEVCKAIADMVLLDDSFASLVSGIEQGRLMIDNFTKCIAHNMTSKLPVILPFLVFLILGIPLPVGAFTILCINLVTDVLPTVSLVFEEPESHIMKRQPNNARTDTLLNQRMVDLSCGQLGMIQMLAGLYAYFIVMIENGFNVSRLLNIRQQWYSPIINDLRDSYGQEWTYMQRKQLEFSCQTSFFIAIVIVQWACLLVSKTRRSSLFQQGMRNQYMILALLIEAALAVIITYCPKIDGTVPSYSLRATWWFPAIPFSLVIIIYDEGRKYILRHNPGGFVERITYY